MSEKEVDLKHLQDFYRFFTWGILALCGSGTGVVSTSGEPLFPLEAFKRFINEKPTITSVDFKCRVGGSEPGRKDLVGYRGVDIASTRLRTFHLLFENASSFLMTELEDELAENEFGAYGGTSWNSLSEGNERLVVSYLGIGVQLLNFGLPNLGTNTLEWTGLNFCCPSNEIGAKLSGVLRTNEFGQPQRISFEIEYQSQRYPYEIQYEFARSKPLPDFFPSRVTLTFVGRELPVEVVDFTVTRLTFSAMPLSYRDAGRFSAITRRYLDPKR